MAGLIVDVKELEQCYLFVVEIPGLNVDMKVRLNICTLLHLSFANVRG